MRRFFVKAIIFALLMVTLSTLFTGCGGNDENKTKEEQPHACVYNFGVCTCGAIDETYYTPGIVFALDEQKQEYTITDYSGTALKVMIPATYNGLPVTKIGKMAFSSDMSFARVNIGKNVHTIEEMAFYGAQRLVEIVIPKQIKNIGIKGMLVKLANI